MITKTEIFYYFILFVYISLWTCQLVACHLTHSLIILTESYINLYRILDISLGLLHLRTQKALAKLQSGNKQRLDDHKHDEKKTNQHDTMAGKLFNSMCTYQFKRLPLLGAFVNGLFLAALLMSAAIEGIQTCFHSGHSQGHEQKTILEESAHTYPIVLVGFALVGLIMQYCSMRAHEMREQELCSDSLMDLARLNAISSAAAASGGELEVVEEEDQHGKGGQTVIAIRDLNVNDLQASERHKRENFKGKRQSYDLNSNSSQSIRQELPLTIRSNEIAHDDDDDKVGSRISLKSLRRISLNLDSGASQAPIESISKTLTTSQRKLASTTHRDNWFWVRYLTSPLALVACAAIFYFTTSELAKEISDAMLAVTVVVLLFAASYPPMKRAGRILLQTTPDGVNLDRLKRDLERSSSLVLEVRDLHVWSLTPRSNRVATCALVLDKKQIENEQQVREIIAEARYRFLDQNIKCTTIEPVLEDIQQREAAVN